MSFLRAEIGIDLGTVNVVVYKRGKGIIIQEPSVVAMISREEKIVEVGEAARQMYGRTPDEIEVARPVRDGVIADYQVTQQMLRYFVNRVKGLQFLPPRIVIGVPYGVTSVERRAVREAAIEAGAGEVFLLREPLAAALGAGLPVDTATGNLVLDLGGGTAEAAVVSMNGIVVASSVRIGGIKLDEAIQAFIRRKYNLAVGEPTAEDIKIRIGSALPLDEELVMQVQGRDQVTGLPRTIEISSSEVTDALQESAHASVGLRAIGAGEDAARTGLRHHRPRHGHDRRHGAAAQTGRVHVPRSRGAGLRRRRADGLRRPGHRPGAGEHRSPQAHRVHAVILASASPRRRELLAALGVEFEVRPSNIDETPLPGEMPLDTQHRVTLMKARAANARDHQTVIAADTTVLLDGEMLNKPADADDARRMLRRLRGRAHEVQSCVVIKQGERETMEIVSSLVLMRDYGDDEIEAYIATGDPFDKAGAYAVQHPGFKPVADIRGCPLNVVGLPLCCLRRHLPELPEAARVCLAFSGRTCEENRGRRAE